MGTLRELKSRNPGAFKTTIVLYALWGIQSGIVSGFFILYILHSLSIRDTMMMLNLGAALGFGMLFLFKKTISKLGTHNRAIAFENLVLFLADIGVVAAYYFPEHARLAALMNGFLAGGMSTLYPTYMESYIMHLYGLENRAKLTGIKNVVTNASAAAALFTAYSFYKNVLFTIALVEILRLLIVIVVFTHPKIPIYSVTALKKQTFERKIMLALTAVLLLQITMRIFFVLRPKIIKEVAGADMVSIGTGLSMLVTIFLFQAVLKYTTEYGKIIRRVGWGVIATAFSLLFLIKNDYTYVAAAIVTAPLAWFYIMTIRHYLIKKLPSSETTNVLYSVNLLNYIGRFFIAGLTAVIVGGTVTYYYLAIGLLALSAVFMALSKIKEISIKAH